MKMIFLGVLTTLSVFVFSCSDNASTKQKEEQSAAAHDTAENAEVKVVKASFTNVDAGVAANIKKITDNYLQLKNALTNGKANEASDAANNIFKDLKTFDKSLLTAEQKKVYDQQEEGLKENAEHISGRTDNIEHQRKHFVSLSAGMYALAKAFGGGKTLYHDHCPMAQNGKGAMWLSETKEIKNPYFGDKMMECGSVEEEIQ
jgi:hypothetical protein